jgi:hypothetical protein
VTDYGGWGGVAGGREKNADDVFEMTVDRVLGAKTRASRETAVEMWSALANVDWKHTDGDTASYTFRAAGDMIAAIRGEGDYMDWYCAGPTGVVSEEIAAALEAEGWSWQA